MQLEQDTATLPANGDAPGEAESTHHVERELRSKPAIPSEFESLCLRYIESNDKPSTLIDKIARSLLNDARTRKICRFLSIRNGVNLDDVEEVIQRVLEIFVMKMLPKLRDAEGVSHVVYSIADKVTREVFREGALTSFTHDSIEEMAENGQELEIDHHKDIAEDDLDSSTDKRLITERMNKAISAARNGEFTMDNTGIFSLDQNPLVSFVPPSPDTSPVEPQQLAPQGRRKGGSRATLSADQAELVSIAETLAMRNQDFAVYLGIGLPRLSSYIYGRTASVPTDVMNRARELLTEQKKTQSMNTKKFGGKMSEIVAGWEKRLRTATNEELAGFLGVTTMTIHRWKNDLTTPDMTALVRYDAVVEHWARTIGERLATLGDEK